MPIERALADDTADELVSLLLDTLGPALAWYRSELARRLGLDPAELACLDLLRRFDGATSGRIGERTGLTRGGVAKMVHRLEREGHLERVNRPERGQALEVALRPHEERDGVIESLRGEVRRIFGYVVTDGRLDRPERRHAVATALLGAAECLHTVARHAVDDAAEERRRR